MTFVASQPQSGADNAGKIKCWSIGKVDHPYHKTSRNGHTGRLPSFLVVGGS